MKYSRSYQFSADSAMLPEEVLEEIAAEVMNYHGSGRSVLEMAPDSPAARQITEQALSDLRKLLALPDSHALLFLRDRAAAAALPGVRDCSARFLAAPLELEAPLFADLRCSVGPDGVTAVILPREQAAGLTADAPACWPVYCCGKVFRYLLKRGGLDAARAQARENAALLRDFLRKSRYFSLTEEACADQIVAFTAPSAAENEAVFNAARAAHLVDLEGPDCLRAALGVTLPRESAEALTDFLRKYEAARK